MNINVVKFGGSSFRKLEDYHPVCDILIRRLRARPHRLVVVVSAMYGHTDRLLEAARSLNPDLSGAASDSLLTTGEFMSASLLNIALERHGIRSTVLNAYGLGILSDSSFTQASIRSVDCSVLWRELQNVEVCVVTGAQAIDGMGRITMLGRNSSDLTAVALAAALGLQACEIYSDVPGVYSADPYVFPTARLLSRVPLWQIIQMSRSGAKVIHFGAAEYAKRARVQILCRATSQPERIGTVIALESPSAPAMVLNEKARFFEFDSDADLTLAESRLSTWGVASVCLNLNGSPVLAVTQGVLSVSDFLRSLKIPFRQLVNQGLITVIEGSGRVERIVAEADVLRTLACQYHDRICGNTPVTVADEPLAAGVLAMSAGCDASSDANVLPWMSNREN